MRTVKLKKPLESRKKTLTDISNCDAIADTIEDNEKQISIINKLFLDETFSEKNVLTREIRSKISGYRQQDIEKGIFNEESIITMEQTVEKLVESRLKCLYCNCNMKLFYKNQREPSQWTLDRKNNNLDHSNENTVVSCLKCNLERRRRNMKDFKFSKQLAIVKK